ncbi:MAG: hypothetical protein E7161_02710 [Firmicutes bacterium]|nr:hypothetical protein [Bacillota bacterium]
MEITKVYVNRVNKEGSKLKGYATIEIDGCLEINNIRIIEGKERIFCAMPSRKINDEKFEDYVHPKNQETRDMFENKILEEYNNPTIKKETED